MSHTRIAVLLHYNHPVRVEQTLPPSVTFRKRNPWFSFYPLSKKPFCDFFSFLPSRLSRKFIFAWSYLHKGRRCMCVCVVWCGVVCLDVKTRRSHTVLAPPSFYGMWISLSQLLSNSHYCLSMVRWGAPRMFLQKEWSVSSPQAVSALKTKTEQKDEQLWLTVSPFSFQVSSQNPASLAIRTESSVEQSWADSCFLKIHGNAAWCCGQARLCRACHYCGGSNWRLEMGTPPLHHLSASVQCLFPWIRSCGCIKSSLHCNLHTPRWGPSEQRTDPSLASQLKSLGKETKVIRSSVFSGHRQMDGGFLRSSICTCPSPPPNWIFIVEKQSVSWEEWGNLMTAWDGEEKMQ